MSEEKKFGGLPVIIAHFDKDDKEMKITSEEHYSLAFGRQSKTVMCLAMTSCGVMTKRTAS